MHITALEVKTYNRMFPFITKAAWNPLGGECKHNCVYCWAKRFAKRNNMEKYSDEARLWHSVLEEAKRFKAKEFVFACDMVDIMEQHVPSNLIQEILDTIEASSAKFLLCTKNPERYHEFKLSQNVVAGATIESDINWFVSDAPQTLQRLDAMHRLKHPKMLSIEPILRFTSHFIDEIVFADPEFVAVGYDNYHAKLAEPTLAETQNLVSQLEDHKITVYLKTIRKANHEMHEERQQRSKN